MVVLATKLYVGGEARERALDSLTALVGNALDGLDAEATVGVRDDDFPSVTVTGPDAAVARSLLREEWGAVEPDGDGQGPRVRVGSLEGWDGDGFRLDAGDPVRVPADQLGLGPGDPASVRTRFGLVQHTPLRFVRDEEGTARLADAERDRLFDWTRGPGRVNVNSATRAEVRATVNRAGHAEDVITVERLGLLEQSIRCRPGTDPPGLLASIGDYLPAELLCTVP